MTESVGYEDRHLEMNLFITAPCTNGIALTFVGLMFCFAFALQSFEFCAHLAARSALSHMDKSAIHHPLKLSSKKWSSITRF